MFVAAVHCQTSVSAVFPLALPGVGVTEETTPEEETSPIPLALFPRVGVTEKCESPKETRPIPLALFPRVGVTKETMDMDLQKLCNMGPVHESDEIDDAVDSTTSLANGFAPYLGESQHHVLAPCLGVQAILQTPGGAQYVAVYRQDVACVGNISHTSYSYFRFERFRAKSRITSFARFVGMLCFPASPQVCLHLLCKTLLFS